MKTVSDPQISPDGAWIAYTVKRSDIEADETFTQIFMVSSDGKSLVHLTANDYSASMPRWSADGVQLSFLAAKGDDKEAESQVWALGAHGLFSANCNDF